MFKSSRWRSTDKNKINVVFKFKFSATQVNGSGLVATVIPTDTGKPTQHSDTADTDTTGECRWQNPVLETTTMIQDHKTGKISKKLYRFLVSSGSTKSRVLGEASVDLADYYDVFKPKSVSLPIQGSNAGAILHVTLQRMPSDNDEIVEDTQRKTLKSRLSFPDSGEFDAKLNEVKFHSSRNVYSSDSLTKSSSFDAVSVSGSERSISGSTFSSEETGEKQRSDLGTLARQLEVAELELQTLRKQVVKESKRAQDVTRELSCVKEERDALRRDFYEIKASKKMLSESENDPWSIIEELKEELEHEKSLNADLRLQLEKTQESESDTKSEHTEQFALDELVKKPQDVKDVYSQEQIIFDLNSELELYKKDPEDLEMQLEQLALDYEILKQENHNVASKLDQIQLREQLRMQYECSAHLAVISDLENHVDSLEAELRNQGEVYEANLANVIREKVEQEKRAIEAEEMLRKMRRNSANTAERLQEEVTRLSSEVSLMFDATEKIVIQKVKESKALQEQLSLVKEEVKKSSEEHDKLRHLKDEQDETIEFLNSEVGKLREQYNELKRSVNDDELEKESLKKQFALLREFTKKNIHRVNEHDDDVHQDDHMVETSDSGEMVNLKKRNQCMENELKEMQKKNSEMSVKFAEVEGERQQFVMTIRALKNALKN